MEKKSREVDLEPTYQVVSKQRTESIRDTRSWSSDNATE